MLTYTVVLLAEADGRYSALVPALPGAVSWGDTVEDALANITEAIAALLEAMGADHDEIPVERPHAVVTTVTVPAPEPATAVA